MSNDTAALPSKPRTRCVWTPEERAEWLRLLEESGKPLSEFCRENGLPESTVSLWRKQLRDPTSTSDSEFIEVPLPSRTAISDAPRLTIRIGDVAVEATAGTDAAWLAELVRQLRREA